MQTLVELLTSGTFWTAVGSLAAVLALFLPLLLKHRKVKLEEKVRRDYRHFGATVVHQNRVTHIASVDFPKTLPWFQASQALCATAEALQDPSRYKLLDVEGAAWLEKPATIGELNTHSIALVDTEFSATVQDDPYLVAKLIRSQK
jgi:hypothetical protein